MGHIWEIVPAQRRFQHAVALCPGSGREVESPLRLTSRAVHGARSGGRDRRRRAAVSAVVLTNAYQPPPPRISLTRSPFQWWGRAANPAPAAAGRTPRRLLRCFHILSPSAAAHHACFGNFPPRERERGARLSSSERGEKAINHSSRDFFKKKGSQYSSTLLPTKECWRR